MRRRLDVVAVIVAVVFVGACSYALPEAIQHDVDSLVQQTESLYGIVDAIKAQASGSALTNAMNRYNELADAHDGWMNQVERAISKEIDHFENDEQYINSVNKLNDASRQFEEAADAAIGGSTDVPDFADEGRRIIKASQNERKMKKAAGSVFEQLQLKRWDEVGAKAGS